MKFDTSQKGLLTIFKPYQAALLEHIWKLNNPSRTGVTSNQAYKCARALEYLPVGRNLNIRGFDILL